MIKKISEYIQFLEFTFIALTVLYPGYHYNIGGYKMSENTDINQTEWTDIMMSL